MAATSILIITERDVSSLWLARVQSRAQPVLLKTT
jgi:hypothetical protein